MKKCSYSILICLLTISLSTFAAAEEFDQESKFKRGVVNIITSPLEIPRQLKLANIGGKEKVQQKTVWFFTGLVKGASYTVARIGSGVWDIATFNLAIPANYEPVLKPAYVFGKEESLSNEESIR